MELVQKKIIPVRGIRKIIARNMLNSIQNSCQLTMTSSCDATQLMELRKSFKSNSLLKEITINDLLITIVSRIVARNSSINGHFYHDKIIQFSHVNIGFAVDTPKGLFVPVIEKSDTLTLRDLSIETKRLIRACKDGTITMDEMSGGTFTISSLGTFGIEIFTPVINSPEIAILGVGTISECLRQKEMSFEFYPRLSLSLTIDHQAIDGAPAARFLQELTQNITEAKNIIHKGDIG